MQQETPGVAAAPAEGQAGCGASHVPTAQHQHLALSVIATEAVCIHMPGLPRRRRSSSGAGACRAVQYARPSSAPAPAAAESQPEAAWSLRYAGAPAAMPPARASGKAANTSGQRQQGMVTSAAVQPLRREQQEQQEGHQPDAGARSPAMPAMAALQAGSCFSNAHKPSCGCASPGGQAPLPAAACSNGLPALAAPEAAAEPLGVAEEETPEAAAAVWEHESAGHTPWATTAAEGAADSGEDDALDGRCCGPSSAAAPVQHQQLCVPDSQPCSTQQAHQAEGWMAADAALAAERTARLAAEAELRRLAAAAQEEQDAWQEQLAERDGQLRAAHSALRALEGKVAALQAELQAEQERRQAAEQAAAHAQQQEAELAAQLRERASAAATGAGAPGSNSAGNTDTGDSLLLQNILQELAALRADVQWQHAQFAPVQPAVASTGVQAAPPQPAAPAVTPVHELQAPAAQAPGHVLLPPAASREPGLQAACAGLPLPGALSMPAMPQAGPAAVPGAHQQPGMEASQQAGYLQQPAGAGRQPRPSAGRTGGSPVSARQQLMQLPRSPQRWDYRPAWNMASEDGRLLRVDDLPAAAAAAARARQQGATEAESNPQQPEQHPQQALPLPPPPQEQQWLQPAQAAPPAAYLYPGALVAAPGSPTGGPVIHQYFAAPPSPPSQQQQQQHQHSGAAGAPADADWQSRPPSAGSLYSLQWQAAAYPQVAPMLVAPLHIPTQPGSWAQARGQGPASSAQGPAPQQRPPTPGAGLAPQRPPCSATAGGGVPAGTATVRPRSASARDKPLAVPPGQVDEGALAAARAEYVREKERIRAKRTHPPATSPPFHPALPGKHKHIFDDLHSFSLASRTWRRLEPEQGPHPVSRWKAGNAQAVQDGLVIVGGDAYWPGTFEHEYTMDVWRLGYPSLKWTEARLEPTAPRPLARRGQSLVHYQDKDGVDRIVLFGGRTQTKALLNDAWEVALLWSKEGGGRLNATWRQLTPLQPAGEAAPAPRRGHSAVMLPQSDGPRMLVYGGREDLYYYGDLWLLDIAGRTWSRLEVAEGPAPSARDHHGVALFRGEMVAFGGHTGPDYCHGFAANDVWAFHLANRTWREAKPAGLQPLPRFEQAYVQYAPQGSDEASRLLVYAGQTAHVCQLNDVHELDMDSWRWEQLSAPAFCTDKCQKKYGRGRLSARG
ncbi:hypothetical protein ABPG75_013259 [Micractinium tetrahymenae]